MQSHALLAAYHELPTLLLFEHELGRFLLQAEKVYAGVSWLTESEVEQEQQKVYLPRYPKR